MSLYDTIYGTSTVSDNINYTTETPDVTYPDSQFTNVLGTVFLPRIYGKDLSYLEIGSSGKIAVTLTDIHSFDIGTSGGVIDFTAENSEAFKFVPKDALSTVAIADMTTYSQANYQQLATSNSLGFNFVNDVNFGGAVSITGTMDLSGNLDLASNLTIGGTAQFVGSATFSNDLLVNGKLEVVSPVKFDSTLQVVSSATFSNDLLVVGSETVQGDLTVQGNELIQGGLQVVLPSTFSNNLLVVGDETVQGDLTVQGDELVQGGLQVVLPATFSNNLLVVGSETVQGDLTVQGDELIQGGLQVVLPATFSNDLLVVGSETIQGDLTVQGDELVQGGLQVVLPATFSNDLLVVGSETVQGDLTVQGDELIQGGLQVVLPATFSNNLLVNGVADFTNTVTISNLVVTDNVTFTGSVPSVFNNLVVNGVSTLNGKVDVNDAVGISNDLLVQGPTVLNNTLDVTGNATLSNDVLIKGTLQVMGAVALSNTLNVDAKSTFNDAVVIGVNDSGTNLSSVYLGIGTNTPSVTLDMSARTDGVILPSGTNSTRPTGVTGTIRYNTELQTYEGFGNGAWNGLGGVVDVNKDTYISAETSPNTNNDQLKFFTSNVQRMIIDDDGTVGIGTDVNPTPGDYALYVKGKTHFDGYVNMNQNFNVENLINAQHLGVGVDAGVSNNLTVGGQVFADEYVAAGTMQLTAPTIKLNGNVEITGSLDTIATETITVEDLWITLASSGNSNAPTVEGGLDDKSGILVEGIPSTFTVSASNAKYYEKSIRWNIGEGDGTKSLGQTTNFRDDPYWQFKGGSLLISRYSSNYGLDYTDETNYDIPEVGYMLRINNNEELEIVKTTVTSAGIRTGTVISKFGVKMPNLVV